LNNVTTESIHRKSQGITTDRLSDLDDLISSTMLEATLHKEVAKAIDHQWIGLSYNSLNDLKFLITSANFLASVARI